MAKKSSGAKKTTRKMTCDCSTETYAGTQRRCGQAVLAEVCGRPLPPKKTTAKKSTKKTTVAAPEPTPVAAPPRADVSAEAEQARQRALAEQAEQENARRAEQEARRQKNIADLEERDRLREAEVQRQKREYFAEQARRAETQRQTELEERRRMAGQRQRDASLPTGQRIERQTAEQNVNEGLDAIQKVLSNPNTYSSGFGGSFILYLLLVWWFYPVDLAFWPTVLTALKLWVFGAIAGLWCLALLLGTILFIAPGVLMLAFGTAPVYVGLLDFLELEQFWVTDVWIFGGGALLFLIGIAVFTILVVYFKDKQKKQH